MPIPAAIRRPAASASAPIVVIGATGGLGRGIVEALLEAGTPVLAVARDSDRLAALRRDAGESPLLGLVPGSLASDAEGAALAAVLQRMRRAPGGVVVSISGGRERARLLQQPATFLDAALQANTLPVQVAARHLLPLLLKPQRRLPFLVLGGPAADTPWAGYGHMSVAAAAQRMLVRVLRNELEGQSVRVQQLLVPSPVRTVASGSCCCPEWPSAAQVGRAVCAVLADSHSSEALVRLAFPPQVPASAAHAAGG